ncbi:hypothetical protein D9M71_662680 [compost metagenome]
MYPAYTDTATIAIGHVQGIDDLQANQAGAQAKGPEQLADVFIAGTLVFAGFSSFSHRLALRASRASYHR